MPRIARSGISLVLVMGTFLASTAISTLASDDDLSAGDPLVVDSPVRTLASAQDPITRETVAVVTFTNRGEETCFAFGEMHGDEVGRVDASGFAPLPLDLGSVCSVPRPLYVSFEGTDHTVMWGVASSTVNSVALRTEEGVQNVPIGEGGAFILPLSRLVQGGSLEATLANDAVFRVEVPDVAAIFARASGALAKHERDQAEDAAANAVQP